MGGLRRKLPFTHAAFVVGVLAIIGFPVSRAFQQEDVIGSAFARASHGDSSLWIVWVLTVAAAGLTSAYMFRLLFWSLRGVA
jgi:NADH-quinone oxidoreductase subunit L